MAIPDIWQQFSLRHALSSEQDEQFRELYQRVLAANQLFNITAIEEVKSFIAYHFDDSLAFSSIVDISKISQLVDVGTGAGFPALPLKILFPALPLILIEVTRKKREFLEQVCASFGFRNVEIYPYDWRTFLRKTSYEAVEYVIARASLHSDELVRMFQPGSPYKQATLAYWASSDWVPRGKEMPYYAREAAYSVGSRRRKFVFFAHPAGCNSVIDQPSSLQ